MWPRSLAAGHPVEAAMIPVRSLAIALFIVAAVPALAPACTFCSGPLQNQQTLRMRFAQAKLVAHGVLKNARFDPKTDDGHTDFHFSAILKDDPARRGQTVLIVPRYLPLSDSTPPDYLLFCDVIDGGLVPSFGIAVPVAVAEYLREAGTRNDSDPAQKLGFFFAHLDSADPVITADAFLEFARTPDADILRAARHLDAAKVRKLIADPRTPAERLGVFAFLLGLCGTPADADFLAGLVKQSPLSERSARAFGGLLAGYIPLAPQDGWAFAEAILGDPKRPLSERLSALGAVRSFQATRSAEYKREILACCAALLPDGDLADQAIEDLRRWGYWELTDRVLSQYGKPTHAAPIVRRCIVRYALSCPQSEAKAFLAALRQTEPKLVRDVEDMLARFAAPAVPKR